MCKSCSRFSKRDKLRADTVRRLQYVEAFTSDINLVYSVMTNSVRNNPISRRDINVYNDIIVRSKNIAQGKTTMTSYDPIDYNNHIVESPQTTLDHYGNAQLETDIVNLNNVPFLTCLIT